MNNHKTIEPKEMPLPFFTAYGPKRKVKTSDGGPSLTEQQHAKDCDINVIVDRYMSKGQAPLTNFEAIYGEMPTQDYATMLQTVIDSQEAFYSLPSKVREKFANNPAELIDFVSDPANNEAMYELGLKERPQPAPEPPRS